jgi:hypothetical protein
VQGPVVSLARDGACVMEHVVGFLYFVGLSGRVDKSMEKMVHAVLLDFKIYMFWYERS